MIEGPLLNSAFAGDEALKSPIKKPSKKARVPLWPLLARSGRSPAKLFITTIRFRASLSEINIDADRRS
jgi:hypothetical protein